LRATEGSVAISLKNLRLLRRYAPRNDTTAIAFVLIILKSSDKNCHCECLCILAEGDSLRVYYQSPISLLNSLYDFFSIPSCRLLPCASIVTIAGKFSTSNIHIASVTPNSSSFHTSTILLTLSAR